MQEFHTQLKAGGRIVIPMECRDVLKIKEGDEIVILINNDQEAVIYSLEHAIQKARNIIKTRAKNPKNLVNDLITARRDEASDE